jgi:F-type H+-transporting ATPase subunit delta
MSKFSGALARRYGTALYETLVKTSETKEIFQKQAKQIAIISFYCTKKIIHNFALPSLTNEDTIKIFDFFLSQILKDNEISPQLHSFLKLILINNRVMDIKPILKFFLVKADEYLGIAHATLISARPIKESDVQEFGTSLETVLKKRVIFKTEIDESLKSGFVVKIGHMKIDSSFKTRLNGLKELFI